MNIPHWLVIAWAWVGVFLAAAVSLALLALAWMWAVETLIRAFKFTHWIVAWMWWCKGNTGRAKMHLEVALDLDAGKRREVYERLYGIELAAKSLLISCAVEGKDDELAMPEAGRALPLIRKLSEAVDATQSESGGAG